MDEAAIERILNIVRPTRTNQLACKRDVERATEMIMWMRVTPTKRQMKSDIKKLKAALKVLEQPWYEGRSLARELTEFICIHTLTMSASAHNRGRSSQLAYVRKSVAAEWAFRLLLCWSDSLPTLTEHGAYIQLTEALYEGATGETAEKAGEMITACEEIIHRAKKHGYNPHKKIVRDPGAYIGYDYP